MGNAFAAFFAAIQSFFLAMQGFGRAAQNLSNWADQATATFVDEAEADRAVKLLENKARRVRAEKELRTREAEYLTEVAALPAPAASAS